MLHAHAHPAACNSSNSLQVSSPLVHGEIRPPSFISRCLSAPVRTCPPRDLTEIGAHCRVAMSLQHSLRHSLSPQRPSRR